MKSFCFLLQSAQEVIPQAAVALDSSFTLVLVFGAPLYGTDEHLYATLKSAFERSHLLGCSSAGEIFGTRLEDGCLSIAVLQFEHTRVRIAHAEVPSGASSFEAGQGLRKSLEEPDLSGILVLTDGLTVNGSALINGINEGLPSNVVVTGGMAGDGADFRQTWVMADGQQRSGLVGAVGFYGDHIQLSHGSQGGWDLFGPERKVTRSHENVLYELNGKPALELYKFYLGELAAKLPASAMYFPLSIRTTDPDGRRVVRSILSIDEATNAIRFAGDIPNGSNVQLMRGNSDRLVQGAADAATRMIQQGKVTTDAVCVAVSCVGRRLLLGERTEDELDAIAEQIPSGMPVVGFYSYRELSPLGSGRCELHNKTMTLTMIGEV